MKNLIQSLFTICLFLSFQSTTWATHYLGSEITYTCVGANQYDVRLKIFTDCNSIGYGATQNISFSSATCTNFNQTVNQVSGSPTDITPICATQSTNCNGGAGVYGIEVYEYSAIVTLTGGCSDWEISYSACCRNGSATNIMNSSSHSYYVSTTLNDNISGCNSSPQFIDNEGVKYGCAGDTLYASLAATDADGDSLVYSLVDVKSSSTVTIPYNSGLSGMSPFVGTTVLYATTGEIKISTNVLQSGYLAVKVDEYRNGVKIGEVTREVIYVFSSCTNSTPKLQTVNGIPFLNSSNLSFSINPGNTIQLNMGIYDAEIAAGTQNGFYLWKNAPTGSTVMGGTVAAPSFTWTPTVNDVGRHSFILDLEDDNCPTIGKNAYTVTIDVINTAANPNFASTVQDTLAAGAYGIVCMDDSNLGTLASATILGDSLNNATILYIDLFGGCMTVGGDSIAIDTIYILLCDNAGICDTNTLILDVQQGVWPGDTDVDYQVDNYDLLNIGLGFATSGIPRQIQTYQWDGYITPDWNKFTPITNINYKHVDTDGNGVINAADTVAVAANWGNSYTFNYKGAGLLGTIPFYVDASATPTAYQVQLPIVLGSPNIPATNIYGLAFSIQYDTSLIKINTADISLNNSWMGTAGTDLISIHKDFYNNGVIKVAITRTDGNNVSGDGQIGTFDFTIQDDIMLFKGNLDFIFDIIDFKIIDNLETDIPAAPQQTTLSISTNTENQYLNSIAKVFPNPVSEVINIELTDLTIEDIIMYNVTGQVVKAQTIQQNQAAINVQDLPKGIYTISIITQKGILNKKMVKQ